MIEEIKRSSFDKLFMPGIAENARQEGLTIRQYMVSITDEEETVVLPCGEFKIID